MRKLATPILVPGGLTAGGIPASGRSQPETSRRDEMNAVRQPLPIKVFFVLILAALMTAGGIRPADCAPPALGPPSVLASGLQSPIGSTIGPDGALYVAEGPAGRISRVDPQTGNVTTFASGLPKAFLSVSGFPIGGPTDVAFIGRTAYVLVTLVSSDVGGNDIDGIYRVDGPNQFTPIADIGQFNLNNQPTIRFAILVKSGVLFALQPYQGGFLVTDGHLNRVLSVSLGGQISVAEAFDDIVPTGLTLGPRHTVFMAEAGPVPHLAQNGKVVQFRPNSPDVTEVASGASLLVGVRFAGGHLYALSQGPGVPGAPAGSPAQPNSGALVRANLDGTFTFLVDHINLPASFNFIGNTAYVVTLTGEVLQIDHVLGAL
jgi:hypothetical protein